MDKTQNVENVSVAPTSELLTELNGKLSAQKVELRATETDADFDKISDVIAGTKSAIKAEIANIANLAKVAKIAEARQLRAGIVTNFEAAVLADAAIQSGKGNLEGKLASSENLAGLREALVNEMLAKHPASTTTTTGGTAAAGEKGATGKRILTAIESGLAAGQAWTDIKAGLESGTITGQPESRGTVGAVYTKYKKDNGIA